MANEQETTTYEEALEAGFWGYVPDPTPNDNYTVSGVTADAPTPETDEDAKQAVIDEREDHRSAEAEAAPAPAKSSAKSSS